MKKILSIIIFLLFSISVYAQAEFNIETLVPDSSILVIKTSKIKRLVQSINFVMDNLLNDEDKAGVKKEIDDLEKKMGFNFLDEPSLAAYGIDTGRRACAAYLEKGTENDERILLFLPVMNEKMFPLKFVEVLKNMYPGKDSDVYPVITSYQERTLYQFHKDIFGTTLEGNFIISSNGDQLKKVVDMWKSGSRGILDDKTYQDYLIKNKENNDIDIFGKHTFLVEVYNLLLKTIFAKPEQKKQSKNKISDLYLCTSTKQEDPETQAPEQILAKDSAFLNAIDYFSVGLKQRDQKIFCDIGGSFNRSHEDVNLFLDAIKTGLHEKAVFSSDASSFLFVAFDFDYFENLCKKESSFCLKYKAFKDSLEKELGINVSKDLIPHASGIMNMVMGSSSHPALNADFVFCLPMESTGKADKLWEIMNKKLKSDYETSARYGVADNVKGKVLWYIDNKEKKNILAVDDGVLYIGTNLDMVISVMQSPRLVQNVDKNTISSRLDDDIFAIVQVKKQSFFKTMYGLSQSKKPEKNDIFKRVGDVVLIAKKRGSYLMVSLEIEIVTPEK